MIVTVWTTKADVDASADAGASLRATAAEVVGATAPKVETFEVGFAELVS